MKILKLINLLLIAAVVPLFSDCDLFGDDDHCINTTTDSKIWNANQYYIHADGLTEGFISFYESSDPEKRSFQLTDVCPYGAVVMKIKLTEVSPITGFKPIVYKAILFEKGFNKYKQYVPIPRKTFYLSSFSPTELRGEATCELVGLADKAGKKMYLALCGVYKDGDFSSKGLVENYTKSIIKSVEFTAIYPKW